MNTVNPVSLAILTCYVYSVPDAVSKFTCTIQENPNDVNTLDTIVTWGIPCSLNGKLDVYNVSVHGTRDGYDNHTFSQVEECTDYLANDYMCSVNLKELKGEYNYTFSVYPKILHVDMPGPVKNQSGIIYPPGSKYQFMHNNPLIILEISKRMYLIILTLKQLTSNWQSYISTDM